MAAAVGRREVTCCWELGTNPKARWRSGSPCPETPQAVERRTTREAIIAIERARASPTRSRSSSLTTTSS
ncbi:hypothetical protein ACOMHN_062096 [Nucella lapillus]